MGVNINTMLNKRMIQSAGKILDYDPNDLGTGTIEDPYKIYTAEHLNNIQYYLGVDKYFILMRDIDLDHNKLKNNEWYDEEIGWSSFNFSGNLNGNNKTIINLYSTFKGLFNNIGTGSEVKDLYIKDTEVLGSSHDTGILAGVNRGTIINCHVINGYITANGYSGGFVGGQYGFVYKSSCDATFIGGTHVGIFFGRSTTTSETKNCHASGSITGGWGTGGFAGVNSGLMEHCYSSVDYVYGTSNVGGFCGLGNNDHNAVYCYYDTKCGFSTTDYRGIAKTTNEMQEGSIPDIDIYVDWDNTIWDPVNNNSYPKLI